MCGQKACGVMLSILTVASVTRIHYCNGCHVFKAIYIIENMHVLCDSHLVGKYKYWEQSIIVDKWWEVSSDH